MQYGTIKTTDAMLDHCYDAGRVASLNPNDRISDLADAVHRETGMNRSSAIMYITAVQSMLAGEGFNRSISGRAIRRFLTAIRRDFGPEGLSRALRATGEHIEYRRSLGRPVDSLIALCAEFEGEC